MKNNLPPPLVLMGIPFHRVTFDDALAWAVERISTGTPGYIATANLDFLFRAWQDPELQRILVDADLVIADGAPIVLVSSLFGSPLPARVAGSDLAPAIVGHCAQLGKSVFLLGGAEGVPERAGQVLQERYPGCVIAGSYSPPCKPVVDMDHQDILARISAASPDLLLVAFGAPKQEKWINMHFRTWKVPLAIGVGGTLDFIAGAQKRAPLLFRTIHMEWLFRMMSNPRRLFGRYADDLGFFIGAMARLGMLRHLTSNGIHLQKLTAADIAILRSLGVTCFGGGYVHSVLAAAADEGFVVVDCSGTAWLSSDGLGILLEASTRARKGGHNLWLFGASDKIRKLIALCRLEDHLPICADPGVLVETVRSAINEHDEGYVSVDAKGVLMLTLPHELTAVTCGTFRSLFDAADSGHWTSCIVDGSPTRFIDSAGLGLLACIRKTAIDRSAGCAVSGFHGPVLKTIHAAGMDGILL